MGLFGKDKRKKLAGDAYYLLQPLGNFFAGESCTLSLYSDELLIEQSFSKHKIKLSYNQITDVYFGWKSELTKNSGSPIGRAIAGGLLFGNAGALVGAVSGTKLKEEKKQILIISYNSSQGEEKYICLQSMINTSRKLAVKLRELTGLAVDESEELVL